MHGMIKIFKKDNTKRSFKQDIQILWQSEYIYDAVRDGQTDKATSFYNNTYLNPYGKTNHFKQNILKIVLSRQSYAWIYENKEELNNFVKIYQ